MGSRAINMLIDEEIYKMLKEYSVATGRSMTFVTENGIKTAVSTDCRYGDMPMVSLVVGNVMWKLPEPLAIAIEELMEKRKHQPQPKE